MAKTTRSLSAKLDAEGKSEIMLRLYVSRALQIRLRSNIFIVPSRLNSDGSIIMPRFKSSDYHEISLLSNELLQMEHLLNRLCEEEPEEYITKEFLQTEINNFHAAFLYNNSQGNSTIPQAYIPTSMSPARRAPTPSSKRRSTASLRGANSTDGIHGNGNAFFDTFKEYIQNKKVSEGRKARYKVTYRCLYRYEQYRKLIREKAYSLDLRTFSVEDAQDFEKFLKEEHALYLKYPKIYQNDPLGEEGSGKMRQPAKRGNNVVICLLKCLRAFFHYCMSKSYIEKDPFIGFEGSSTEQYGTPYYISIEERDQIAAFDLSENVSLETQRDIFIFQTLIGCRVSDMTRLKPTDIINGIIEYIPHKTLHERAKVVRVPLNKRGLDILAKYKGVDPQGRILPFISNQKYNDAIKKIFKTCGITRMVTILDSVTGQEVKRPINEIASSHIARRTFVGNLYKKVKDPSLIGALSGHTEGSKAFARYREIDDDIKKELIGYLD